MQQKKLEELTPEQEKRMSEFTEERIKMHLSTSPVDENVANESLVKAYEVAGFEPPKEIVWVDSPKAFLKMWLDSPIRFLKMRASMHSVFGLSSALFTPLGALNIKEATEWYLESLKSGNYIYLGKNKTFGALSGKYVHPAYYKKLLPVFSDIGNNPGDSYLFNQGFKSIYSPKGLGSVAESMEALVEDDVWDYVWECVGKQVEDYVWERVGEQVEGELIVSTNYFLKLRSMQIFKRIFPSAKNFVDSLVLSSIQSWRHAGTFAVYGFFNEILRETALRFLDKFNQMCTGYFLGKEKAIVVRKPIRLTLDKEGYLADEDLLDEDKEAIEWRLSKRI